MAYVHEQLNTDLNETSNLSEVLWQKNIPTKFQINPLNHFQIIEQKLN